MNKVELIGRLTVNPELKYTESGKAYTRFTLAVNRKFKKNEEAKDADFIPIVAWEKRAEIICQYVLKGNRLGIVGQQVGFLNPVGDGIEVFAGFL